MDKARRNALKQGMGLLAAVAASTLWSPAIASGSIEDQLNAVFYPSVFDVSNPPALQFTESAAHFLQAQGLATFLQRTLFDNLGSIPPDQRVLLKTVYGALTAAQPDWPHNPDQNAFMARVRQGTLYDHLPFGTPITPSQLAALDDIGTTIRSSPAYDVLVTAAAALQNSPDDLARAVNARLASGLTQPHTHGAENPPSSQTSWTQFDNAVGTAGTDRPPFANIFAQIYPITQNPAFIPYLQSLPPEVIVPFLPMDTLALASQSSLVQPEGFVQLAPSFKVVIAASLAGIALGWIISLVTIPLTLPVLALLYLALCCSLIVLVATVADALDCDRDGDPLDEEEDGECTAPN